MNIDGRWTIIVLTSHTLFKLRLVYPASNTFLIFHYRTDITIVKTDQHFGYVEMLSICLPFIETNRAMVTLSGFVRFPWKKQQQNNEQWNVGKMLYDNLKNTKTCKLLTSYTATTFCKLNKVKMVREKPVNFTSSSKQFLITKCLSSLNNHILVGFIYFVLKYDLKFKLLIHGWTISMFSNM